MANALHSTPTTSAHFSGCCAPILRLPAPSTGAERVSAAHALRSSAARPCALAGPRSRISRANRWSRLKALLATGNCIRCNRHLSIRAPFSAAIALPECCYPPWYSCARRQNPRMRKLLLTWNTACAAAEPSKGLLPPLNRLPARWEGNHERCSRNQPPQILPAGWRRRCRVRGSRLADGPLTDCQVHLPGGFQCLSCDRQERPSHGVFRQD